MMNICVCGVFDLKKVTACARFTDCLIMNRCILVKSKTPQRLIKIQIVIGRISKINNHYSQVRK